MQQSWTRSVICIDVPSSNELTIPLLYTVTQLRYSYIHNRRLSIYIHLRTNYIKYYACNYRMYTYLKTALVAAVQLSWRQNERDK